MNDFLGVWEMLMLLGVGWVSRSFLAGRTVRLLGGLGWWSKIWSCRKMVLEVSKEIVMKGEEWRGVERLDFRVLKDWGEEFGGETESTVVKWRNACFCVKNENWSASERSHGYAEFSIGSRSCKCVWVARPEIREPWWRMECTRVM